MLGLLGLILLVGSQDVLRLNPAQAAAAPYLFDLVGWEAANFLSKWTHRASRSLPWSSQSHQVRQRQVVEYFQLGERLSGLNSKLVEAAAQIDQDAATRVLELEAELEEIKDKRGQIRNDVEETIESTISQVISDSGIATWGALIFPPVDIRLSRPPKLLVTSPRDRIRRTHDVLVRPNITVRESEAVEGELLEESDLSAVVLDLGGLATYPASVPSNQPLRWTLQISAHEWLHHYFFFRSLGQNIFDSPDMHSLNETVADIAGREIGDRAFELLGGTVEPTAPATPENTATSRDGAQDEDGKFDFDREMRDTRLRVEELLSDGKIREAEAFMEERRKFLVENGHFIRKLNQAYFAFYGTYADSPASVSPIGDQLHRFRDLMPDLGSFLKAMAGVSSYREFLDELQRLEAAADAK